MIKKGTLVRIDFLDHSQAMYRDGIDVHPVPCSVVGWVFRDTKAFIVLTAWISESLDSGGSDSITLVKHTGMRIKRLKEQR